MSIWFSRDKKSTTTSSVKNDDFVSLASHELRTPLSIIKWYTEILLDGDAGSLTEDQRKYLTVIETNNQRAIDLIRSLLNVSRLDLGTFSISPEDVSLNDLLEESITVLAHEREKKEIEITKEYGDIPHLLADKNLCLVFIKNILSNAIAFSLPSGKVTLRTAVAKCGEVIEGQEIQKDSILITCIDHGIGIPDEDRPSIFSKMFRASNVQDIHGDGSGLGLYITKSIVKYSGGKIWFESDVSSGSQFFVALPLTGMVAKKGTTTLD